MRDTSNQLLNRKLRIGLLLDDTIDSQDGVQQYVISLGKWLTSQGHEVSYIVGQSSRRDLDNVYSLATVVRVSFNSNRVGTPLPVRIKVIKSFLKSHQFDVIHVQAPYSPVFAGRLIKHLPQQTAVVVSFHVLPFGKLAHLGLLMLRHLARGSLARVDKFVANTQTVEKFFAGCWGVSSVVVPNPVKVSSFQGAPKHPSTVDDKVNIVFLGRLVKRKGLLNLLDAIALLPSKYRNRIYVHVGGGGPLMSAAQLKLRHHQLTSICRLYGRIDEVDKASFLAMADIAIFPSTGGESFGISLLEAMASGNSLVLAGRNLGYEAVMGVESELLFEAAKPMAIADALKFWLDAPDNARQAKIQWLRHQVTKYDIETSVGPQVLSVYQQALESKLCSIANN